MDNRLTFLTYGVLAGLLLLPSIDLASRIRTRLELPRTLLFAVALLILGVAAEAAFFLTMVNSTAAQVVVWIAALSGTFMTLARLRDPAQREELLHVDSWAPFAAMYAVGFVFIALFAISRPAGHSSIDFAGQWLLKLPDDNLLPHLLAQHIAEHTPPKPFIGAWLSSDRPPLQAGFELLIAALTPFAVDADGRYQALSMLLQAAAFGMLFTLCRLNACSGLRSGVVVLLSAATGFALVNTVFVWPKLLAAAFMLIAVTMYIAPGDLKRGRALAIGAGVGLAFLSHGGVVFTLPILLAVVVLQRRRHALALLATALCAIVLLNAPWTWYQKVYDPPGDRLLKWHLAGQIPVTDVAFGPTLYHAYVDVPIATIVSNKISNIKTLFGLTLGDMVRRGREFFYVGDALGVLGFPFLFALVFVRSKRRMLRSAAYFAWIAVASLGLWALLLYLPHSAVVHVGSYATMLLMFFASGIVVTEWLPVFVVFFTWQIVHFSTVWLTSVDLSNAHTPHGAVAVLVLTTVLGACCALAANPIARRIRSSVTANPFLRANVLGKSTRLGRMFSSYPAKALIVAAFVVPQIVGLVIILHSRAVATVAVVAGPAAGLVDQVPRLNTMQLHAGHVMLSLDTVTINGVSTIVAGLKTAHTFHVFPTDTVILTGWAFGSERAETAGGLEMRMRGQLFSATYGLPRPDVAAAFNGENLTPVGFKITIGGRSLPKGSNAVSFVVVSHNRNAYYIVPTRVILDQR